MKFDLELHIILIVFVQNDVIIHQSSYTLHHCILTWKGKPLQEERRMVITCDSIIHDGNGNDNDSGIVASINGNTYNMTDESYAIRLLYVEA